MPAYRVMINGRNFLFDVDGKRRRMGFYQTVFVEAADATQAELEAVNIVKGNQELRQAAIRDEAIQPSLHLSEMWEIEPSKLPTSQPKGRTFYREKQWWQFWR